MSALEKRPPVFFDHIHKAGGTSAQALLAQLYGKDQVARADVATETALSEFADRAVIAGHVTHSPGNHPFRTRYTFTILRNPIARTLSVYHYFCRQLGTLTRSRSARPEDHQKHISLERFLSGEIHGSDVVRDFQTRHFARLAVGGTSDALKEAIAALEEYHLVGIQEDFAGSMRLLLRDLAAPADTPLPRENLTIGYGGAESIDSGLRKLIEQCNSLDLQLWEWAKDHLTANLDRPAARVITLSQSRITPVPPRLPVPASHAVTLLGAELRSADGRTCRFATGEPVSLLVEFFSPLDVADATVGFSIASPERRVLYGTNTYLLRQVTHFIAGCSVSVRFDFPLSLAPGHYRVGLACHRGADESYGSLYSNDNCLEIEITNPWLPEFVGAVYLPARVTSKVHSGRSIGRWSAPLPLKAIRARIDLPASIAYAALRATPKSAVDVPLQVTNLGPLPLRPVQPYPVAVAYHIRSNSGETLVFDGRRTSLPTEVPPNAHVDLIARIEVPETAGEYAVEVSLVQEGNAWFDGLPENLPVRLALTVTNDTK